MGLAVIFRQEHEVASRFTNHARGQFERSSLATVCDQPDAGEIVCDLPHALKMRIVRDDDVEWGRVALATKSLKASADVRCAAYAHDPDGNLRWRLTRVLSVAHGQSVRAFVFAGQWDAEPLHSDSVARRYCARLIKGPGFIK
jgi:hypothetical protein